MRIMERLIFHIDVNSAYLSWEASYRLQHGEELDLRDIPSVVGGDEASRHGIVLTKSIPAKKYGIRTGETLYEARAKCPELVVVPPRYWIYMQCSQSMNEILLEYTPKIQRFSVDESFLDFSGMKNLYVDYMVLAETIKERIKTELGFTVNIGISENKLLAKVASDLKKPDRIHTLFPEEIEKKMWPLPVEDLFMVGRATSTKLHNMNIYTIGELAKFDPELLRYKMKSHGELIWRYANGIEGSDVRKSNHIEMKGVGNSTTTAFDLEDRETACRLLLSLCETVGMRLRDSRNCCRIISISIRDNSLASCGMQKKIDVATDSTRKIYETACSLFDRLWKGRPIRHMGVQVTELCSGDFFQLSMLDCFDYEKDKKLNRAIDEIRLAYGSKAVMRSSLLHSGLSPMSGGVGEEDYPLMCSIL